MEDGLSMAHAGLLLWESSIQLLSQREVQAGGREDKAEHGIRPGYEHDWGIVAGSSERTLGITGVV